MNELDFDENSIGNYNFAFLPILSFPFEDNELNFAPPPIANTQDPTSQDSFSLNSEKNKEKIFEIDKISNKIHEMIGRKTKNSLKLEEKFHSKYEDDNILRKIQIGFINYLINLTNEILKYFGYEEKFLGIDYKFKKEVNKENFNKIKTKEIGKILCQSISPKFSKISNEDKNINQKIYEKVIQNKTIKNFLSETYIKIFRDYYYKNIKDLNEYNLNIKLSENIKTFDDFLNNKAIPDDDYYKQRVDEIIEKYYLPKKLFVHN